MKNFIFLQAITSFVLLSFFLNNVSAQTGSFDTKTGLPVEQPTGSGSVTIPVSDNPPPWMNVFISTPWNGNFISTVGAAKSDFYAQSFIANMATITKFGVMIGMSSPAGEVLLAIVPDNGLGKPDITAPLYSGSLITPTSTLTWYYETGLNIPVVVGQKYYVLVDGYNNPGATGNSRIGSSSICPIPGENMMYTNDNGSTWGRTGAIALYVEGQPSPVPVPYWAIVLVFVLIGGGAFLAYRRKLAKQAV